MKIMAMKNLKCFLPLKTIKLLIFSPFELSVVIFLEIKVLACS